MSIQPKIRIDLKKGGDRPSANRQFKNIAEAVNYAEQRALELTDNRALQTADVFSKSY